MDQPVDITKHSPMVADMVAHNHPSIRALVLSQLGNGIDVADMNIVELVKVRMSPFDVSSFLDKGYCASSSVSGARFDLPSPRKFLLMFTAGF